MVEEQTAEAHEKPRLRRRLAWYRRQAASVEQQTGIDELTGLRNQRALWRELDRRAQICSPSHPLGIVMVDFDLFRDVNESCGQAIGDAVLQRGASVIRGTTGSPRLVFRYGGEEFVLLTEDHHEARELAERVRAEMAMQNGTLPTVTVSCGVAELHTPFEPWVALDRADAALRDAKRSGRNRVVVAGQTSPGERILLVEELEHETARRAAMALAVATLQVRDSGTADHSDDVLTLCEAVGRRLAFGDRELEHLKAGAQLHDVGKVAMPSAILNKPGALTPDEWDVIREHTVIGERILRSVPEMSEVATIVRHSHEHWDGSGYPDGLSGEEIPAASRVILCADAFHAMRCDRPYRSGRPAHEAIAELKTCRGTQFDPAVVDAFVEVAAATRARPVISVVDPRNRRLIALLTAFVIGGGSAVAGVPEVREAIRSLFGSSVGPTVVDTGTATEAPDFGLGPLGDLLTMKAIKDHGEAKGKKASPGPAAPGDGREQQGPGDRSGAGLTGSGDSPESGGGRLHGTNGPASPPDEATPAPNGAAPAPTGTAPAPTGAVPDTKSKKPFKGNGGALGRAVLTPRQPSVPPGRAEGDGPSGGRTDPPALGHIQQQAKQPHGHSK